MSENTRCEITCIEISKKCCQFLTQKFGSRIVVYQEDIFKFVPHQQFDLVLWVGSGICDFSLVEQPEIITKSLSWMNTGGHYALDLLDCHETPTNVSNYASQAYTVNIDEKLLNGYIPSSEEIHTYFNHPSYKGYLTPIHYTTSTNRRRVCYLFEKVK